MSDARQFDLFTGGRLPPYNRRRRVPASIDGAKKIAPFTTRQRRKILDLIRAAPNGMTSDEICIALNLGPQAVSARLFELRDEELIERNGDRRVMRSGVKGQVHVARRRA